MNKYIESHAISELSMHLILFSRTTNTVYTVTMTHDLNIVVSFSNIVSSAGCAVECWIWNGKQSPVLSMGMTTNSYWLTNQQSDWVQLICIMVIHNESRMSRMCISGLCQLYVSVIVDSNFYIIYSLLWQVLFHVNYPKNGGHNQLSALPP